MGGKQRLQLLAVGMPATEPKRDPEQPDLAPGVHLRWSFHREQGFPWFGYYLFRLSRDGVWRTVPGFTYPFPLPLEGHPTTYPCFGAPHTEFEATDLARSRVKYGDPGEAMAGFRGMHRELQHLAAALHNSGSMGDAAVPQQDGTVAIPGQHPLDLLLLAALHPAAAQILGLYFIDESADPAERYSYLLLADHAGELALEASTKGFARSALDWATANVLTPGANPPPDSLVDYALAGVYTFDNRPVRQPRRVKAYVLPVTPSGRNDQPPPAGLTWELPDPPHEGEENLPDPSRPVLFHLRRAYLGKELAPAPLPPDLARFELVTRGEPMLGLRKDPPAVNDPRPSTDWPPFPLDAIDLPGDEGWYAYLVTGVDLFGRYSEPSVAAEWWQWAPPPEPLPWYYDPMQGAARRDPEAVPLLDKAPPPAPSLEAWTIQEGDPLVVVDATTQEFFDQHPGEVGLRLRWRWTRAQQRIAPDAAEFRIYWRAGADALGGEALRTLAGWQLRAKTVAIDASSQEVFVVTRLGGGERTLEGQGAIQDAMEASVIHVPAAPDDLRSFVPGLDMLRLGAAIHEITKVDAAARTITLTHPAGLAGPASWAMGRLERRYDLAIPAPGAAPSQPFAPDRTRPIVYAMVALTAADGRPHTDDRWLGPSTTEAPQRRRGNESNVGAPALVLRVLRQPPPDPEIAPTPDTRFATPADYHGLSVSTFRWRAQPALGAHVLRALDEAVFMADWPRRPRGNIAPDHELLRSFGWTPDQRTAIASALNAIDAIRLDGGIDDAERIVRRDAAYRGLTDAALRALAALDGNEGAFLQLTLEPVDPPDVRGPDDPPDHQAEPAALRAYVDGTLPGHSLNRYLYRAQFVDGALNRSARSSLPGAAVHLPRVDPPATPVIVSVATNREGRIRIQWQPVAEVAGGGYRVYRSETRADGESLRDMRLLAEVAAEMGTHEFVDAAVLAPRTYYYRLTSIVREGGHAYESAPTALLVARTFDPALLPPELGVWPA